MVNYSFGECSVSLVMNGIAGFAMLYYTDALGLSPALAGMALFISMIWDAVSDPIMGHISDNTRSRFGKRHPYILIGGIIMVFSFFFLWYVPPIFKSGPTALFAYLAGMNLVVRTGFTLFVIPYTALGFEMCSDYDGRTRLQGIRTGLNMASNLLGPAMAWALFFGRNEEVRANAVPANYIHMGTAFSIVAIGFVFYVVFATSRYIRDSRFDRLEGNSLKAFFRDMYQIVTDRYPRWTFVFIIVVILGIQLTAMLQMYVFEHVLILNGIKKTIAHGGTMVGMGLGALTATSMSRRFDKKGAIAAGVLISITCELLLAFLLLTGTLEAQQIIPLGGVNIPITFLTFALLHSLYWFGNGVMMPVTTSMVADVSEIHEIKSGINKSGSYAAVFSLAFKLAVSLGSLAAGYVLTWVGFAAGQSQTPEVLSRLTAVTLTVGPCLAVLAMFLVRLYPVDKQFIETLRAEQPRPEAEMTPPDMYDKNAQINTSGTIAEPEES